MMPVPTPHIAPQTAHQPPAPTHGSPIMAALAALAQHMRGARPGAAGGAPAMSMRVPSGAPPAPPPPGMR